MVNIRQELGAQGIQLAGLVQIGHRFAFEVAGRQVHESGLVLGHFPFEAAVSADQRQAPEAGMSALRNGGGQRDSRQEDEALTLVHGGPSCA